MGLGFYIAPSNCQGYYANHYNKLAPEANAEFTDHWAMREGVLLPTFTFYMRATRKLSANEQILVDYESDFATLEPYQDNLDIGGGDDDEKKNEKDKASEQQPKAVG